jgi:hypothetical protein
MIRILKEYDEKIINETYTHMFTNNTLNILSIKYYQELVEKYGQDLISLIAVKFALYNIPTIELIEFIKSIIQNKRTIEIGSGNGIMAKMLNIKATDLKLQEHPEIKLAYAIFGQEIIKYRENIEKIEALEAVNKYNPEIVIGSWLSDKNNIIDKMYVGVNEEEIIKKAIYVHIGNSNTHKNKTILKYPHKTIDMPLVSRRGLNNNVIWIFDKIN